MRADLVRGNLDLLVLSIVGSSPAHGYAIVEALRRRSGGDLNLPEGTVYPALYRLEAAGLLSSAWSEVGGRRRRVYRVTRAGRRSLQERRREWSAFVRAVSRVVDGAQGSEGAEGRAWPSPA
jgi:DNA-binding PadR family transcriptional regulator